MLYRATPAWDEPTEVREMLDASDELDAIPEDAVRAPCSQQQSCAWNIAW
jgi:hypothetical protein